ncbi:3'-5' exonuclease [Phytohabitans sp. ZYX-F-186]|uniref:3'-5' exonuclease n=1 Tax=Phytohabitans maris TaxID=3071409 RepID=A0ABU0ZXZ2_9ACTN|nr:3'-5' exonuclease [Phytohabitans sp. ZYX-F-186]MDQ7911154.1 3'-5' exonuclease [Phytohabitans sp. ZYX-F-186]
MELVAIDLEGSGAQDRANEAILEIALVPIVDGRPDMGAAYCTLINPGRSIPRRPWISPGLTDSVLRDAPTLAEVEPELAPRINGKHLVGHNVGVDWRLLRRHCPSVTPAGLIDTLRLARQLDHGIGRSLTSVIDHFALASDVDQLAPDSAPHRALWDTVAVALLLPVLSRAIHDPGVRPGDLVEAAHTPAIDPHSTPQSQPSLFD